MGLVAAIGQFLAAWDVPVAPTATAIPMVAPAGSGRALFSPRDTPKGTTEAE